MLIFDVGANDGTFSASLVSHLRRTGDVNVDLHVFEPQPQFAKSLSRLHGRLAPRIKGTYHAALAGTEDGKATLYTGNNDDAATCGDEGNNEEDNDGSWRKGEDDGHAKGEGVAKYEEDDEDTAQ